MDEKYIRQIMKRMKCSKSKQGEIKKQFRTDIMAAIENGEAFEEIQKRMGTPAEIAAEFNSNFSESERKKYKKELWIMRLSLVGIILLVLAAGFYWVLPKTIEIEESRIFHKEEVMEKAEYVIGLIEAEDYETLQENANRKLKSSLNKELLDSAKNGLGADWGEFQSFGNSYLAEVRQMGKRFAVIQINASYENASVTYTISFDEDGKLAGLYMK